MNMKDKLPLVNGDVLLDQPCNLHCLVCLDSVEGIMIMLARTTTTIKMVIFTQNFTVEKSSPADPLLHQVAALHVQVEHSILSLHLRRLVQVGFSNLLKGLDSGLTCRVEMTSVKG